MYRVRMQTGRGDVIHRARAGDPAALDALFGWLVGPAFSLALILLRDREAAEDAVQEAAIRAWRKLGDLRAGAEVRPWFLAFVANQCRNARRARWRSVLKLDGLDAAVCGDEGRVGRGAARRDAVPSLRYDQRAPIAPPSFLAPPPAEF